MGTKNGRIEKLRKRMKKEEKHEFVAKSDKKGLFLRAVAPSKQKMMKKR